MTGVPISGKIKSILLWFWLWLYRVPSIWPITFIFCKTSNSHRSPTIQFSFWDFQTIWLLTSIEVLIGPWRWRWKKPSGVNIREFHASVTTILPYLALHGRAERVLSRGRGVKLTRKSWTGEVRAANQGISKQQEFFAGCLSIFKYTSIIFYIDWWDFRDFLPIKASQNIQLHDFTSESLKMDLVY